MSKQDNMKQFLTSLVDSTRLRLIGLLAEGSMTTAELRNNLGIPLDALHEHLAALLQVGVISGKDGLFSLDDSAIEAFRNQQLHKPREFFDPPTWLDESDRKIIRKLADTDGSLKRLPKKLSHWMTVLRYVAPVFEPGVYYNEKQVNALLLRYNPDTAVLRRYLVDTGMIKRHRDGTRYWREVQT